MNAKERKTHFKRFQMYLHASNVHFPSLKLKLHVFRYVRRKIIGQRQ